MDASREAELPAGSSVGEFQIREALGAANDVRLYRAFEPRLGRTVLIRVATADSAVGLRDDARRVAAVAHPNVVPVLAVADHESGAYAAAPDLDARPLRELIEQHPLTGSRAARIASDIAGAVEALATAGVRVPLDLDTILVASDAQGERALLDPLRASSSGGSRLAIADAEASTHELAELLAQLAPAPSGEIQRALDAVRGGTLTRPSELSRALSALTAAPKRPRRRRTVVIVAAACAAFVLAVSVVALQSRGGRSHVAARPGLKPAARVLARIPLGLAGKEQAVSLAIRGHTIWIATNHGRLIRVDADSNQVVGSGIALGKLHQLLFDIVATGTTIWATDYSGWLLRIDPRTGRVTSKLHLGAYLTAMRLARGVLWVTRSVPSGGGQLLRVSAATMRRIGPPVALPGVPLSLVVRGTITWVTGLGADVNSVTRVDVASGQRSKAELLAQPIDLVLQGNTLWVTGYTDGMVVPINAQTMMFAREAVHVQRAPVGIGAGGADLWVVAQDAPGSSASSVHRLDGSSGRSVGTPVAIAATPCCLLRIVSGLGSIWTTAGGALVRLAPTEPRPTLAAPSRATPSPRTLQAGPLAAGLWKSRAFVAPVTFRVPSFAWQAGYPLADSIVLVFSRRADTAIWVSAPRQVLVTDKKLQPVHGSANLLSLLRSNPHLRVGAVHHIAIAGRQALQFDLATRDLPSHSSVCAVPCVPLFTLLLTTITVEPRYTNRMTILQSGGRTIAILESAANRRGLASTASLLRTFHFSA